MRCRRKRKPLKPAIFYEIILLLALLPIIPIFFLIEQQRGKVEKYRFVRDDGFTSANGERKNREVAVSISILSISVFLP